MEIELHIEELETERRANRLQWFDNAGLEGILGRFLSFRDDNTFVWLRAFSAPLPDQNFVRRETTIHLTPTIGSTIRELSDFARINEPVIELRQYRIAKGQRDRFATFLRDRTLDAQLRLNMQIELLRLSRQFNKTVLFVTHDLDEALYLAQRVIVLSASPGRIAEVVSVPLTYPRNQVATRSDPQYLRLRERLYSVMVEQVTAARAAES